jgi:hypothetical protein
MYGRLLIMAGVLVIILSLDATPRTTVLGLILMTIAVVMWRGTAR